MLSASQIKKPLRFLEEALLHWGIVLADGLGKRAEFVLLVAAELGRDFHLHGDVEIATATARERGHAFFAKSENGAALGADWNFDRGLTVERRHFQLPTERGDGEWKRHRAEKVSVIALEDVVIADVEEDVEIARRAAADTGIAIS